MEPMLITAMRRRIAKGYGNTEVRILGSNGGPMAGTTIRGFVEEYDEAVRQAYERGYDDGVASSLDWP